MPTVIDGYLDVLPSSDGVDAERLVAETATWITVDSRDEIAPGVPCFWKRPPIKVHGRPCRQNRDVAFFAPPTCRGYRYSGEMAPRQEMPTVIRETMEAVNRELSTSFNSCLVNRYNGGRDYIGSHRDDERDLVPGSPVAAVSIGETRTLRIRRHPSGKKEADIPLVHGETVVMWSQKKFAHEIPVQTKRRGTRISFTFREFRAN